MSKIALPIAELKPALIGLGKVIAKRCTLPVLHHVKVERTSEGWIALTGTDLDTFVTVRMEQPSEGEPAVFLVPYDELLKITKTCQKEDKILLGADEAESVTIEYAVGTQVAQAKVPTLPAKEFPSIPRMKGASIPLSETLRTSIQDALECASTDQTRMLLNGACIDVSKPKAHYVVGTDGRHLFSSNSFSLPLAESLIIPSHKFVGWKEFNSDGEWQLKVEKAEKKEEHSYLQLSSRRWRFITRQIEGNYPNWRQVVPEGSTVKTTLTLEPQQLLSIVQTVLRMPCHDEVNGTIGLEWKAGKINLLGKPANATDWMSVPVEGKGIGQEISIFLNRHLLNKALSFGLNTIELNDAKAPLRFVNGGRQMIVIPLRADVGNPAPEAKKEPEKPVEPKAEEPKPAASPAAQPTGGTTTMPANNEPEAEKPTLEKALADIEKMRGNYKEAIRGLDELSDNLKAIRKEQKGTEKELQTVRQTIRGLQSVKL